MTPNDCTPTRGGIPALAFLVLAAVALVIAALAAADVNALCLLPALALSAPLLLRRYPGERALAGLAGARRSRWPRPRASVPRTGRLLMVGSPRGAAARSRIGGSPTARALLGELRAPRQLDAASRCERVAARGPMGPFAPPLAPPVSLRALRSCHVTSSGPRCCSASCALAPAGNAVASTASPNGRIGQESGNPINDQGSSYHYRSYITSITPNVPGLSVEVLEFADRLLLTNHTGQTVTVYGYSGEPYARVLPDGATEQNVRSPAVYLNTNFYANVTVPPSANASAPPKWVVVDRTGQFEWHDHRIHWMSPVTPPQVKDTGKRTKIFDWSVPITGRNAEGRDRRENCSGFPRAPKAPTGAIVALVAIVCGGAARARRAAQARQRPSPHRRRRPGDHRTERGVVRGASVIAARRQRSSRPARHRVRRAARDAPQRARSRAAARHLAQSGLDGARCSPRR